MTAGQLKLMMTSVFAGMNAQGVPVYWSNANKFHIMKSIGLNGFKSDGSSVPQSPAPPASSATESTTYTVKKGDTLWGVAEKQMGNGTLWEQIRNINALTSTVIYPGQVLKIPK
jgi:LysM repeat protein